MDEPARLDARIAEIDARLAGSEPAGETEAAELLLERAELLVLLDQVDDAIETLERLMALATPDGSPNVRITSARGLRMWIELNEATASAADALAYVQRIDRSAEARETLDHVERLLSSDPSSELQDVVLALRAELDNDERVADESFDP